MKPIRHPSLPVPHTRRRRAARRFPGLAVVLGMAAAGCVWAAPASDSPETSSTWRALVASGSVLAQPAYESSDHWVRVRRGDELTPLTLVKTSKRSRATLARDGHLLVVRGNSELELPVISNGAGTSQVLQDSGSVTYEVDGREFDRFEVVTPYLVAGVKGTVFTVDVRDGVASVTVVEGAVEVLNRGTGDVFDLVGGQTIDLGRDVEDAEVRDSLDRHNERIRREVRAARTLAGIAPQHRDTAAGPNADATKDTTEDWYAGNRPEPLDVDDVDTLDDRLLDGGSETNDGLDATDTLADDADKTDVERDDRSDQLNETLLEIDDDPTKSTRRTIDDTPQMTDPNPK